MNSFSVGARGDTPFRVANELCFYRMQSSLLIWACFGGYPLLPIVDGVVLGQIAQRNEVGILLRPLNQVGSQRQRLA